MVSRDRRWRGLPVRLLALVAQADADDDLNWAAVSVDSTIVRAHQHAAGVRKGGSVNTRSPVPSTAHILSRL